MSPEAFTLHLPDALAQELCAANKAFLVELLERGLRAVKIERALDQFARGGHPNHL